jgi:hypothetical protein
MTHAPIGEPSHERLGSECCIVRKLGGRHSLSGDQNELRKSTGAAVAAWLRKTYRPVFEENPTPAFAFMACFLAVMFGILFLMT